MLYKVAWLLSSAKNQSNITFLIDTNDEVTARNICGKYSIAVFSIAEYKDTPESLGKAYIRFDFERTTITLYSELEKAKDLYLMFRDVGVIIKYINNLNKPLSDADVARVLEKLDNDYKLAHAPKAQKDKSYLTKLTELVVEQESKELDKVKKIASKAVEEAEELLEQTGGEESANTIKVKNAADELKRLRLGTNISTLREQISNVYLLMEKLELQHLEALKDNEIKVVEWSIVTYLDLVSEREKYRKTMTLQKAKAQKWFGSYYVLFGTVWLYQKLLGKDFKSKFKNVIIILNGIYDILIMFIMMTTIWLVLLQLFNTIAFKWTFFTLAFIDVWIMGICSALLMKCKRPNIINLVIVWPVCIGLYFLLRTVIYTNFGL